MSWHEGPTEEFRPGEPLAAAYVIPPGEPAGPPVRCHRPVIRKLEDGWWGIHVRFRAPYYGSTNRAERTWEKALKTALEYVR